MFEQTVPVIDAHCHIYPDKIAEKASSGIGEFYDETVAEVGSVSHLLKVGKEAGIDRFLIHSVATKPSQVAHVNEFIAATVRTAPETFIGFGTLHPASESLRDDFMHLRSLGLRGVKLHPDIQGYKADDFRAMKLYELCEEYEVPILMHTGDYRYDFSNANRIAPILEIYEHLTLIAAHLAGYTVWDDSAKTLPGHKNLYVDCSSTLGYMPPEKARSLIRLYGTDRVFFGTDFPLHSPKDEMRRMADLCLTDAEYRAIFSENITRVLHI